MIRFSILGYFGIASVMSKAGTWFYAVKRGRLPGVYSSWSECEKQVKGFPNPAFRKFLTEEEALEFVSIKANGKPASSCDSGSIHKSNNVPHHQELISSNRCSNCNSANNEVSLRSVVANLETTVQSMMTTVEYLRTSLEEVKSTVARLEQNVFMAPGSKRQFSTSARVAEQGGKDKRPKFDHDREHFTGKKFDDSEGVHVYTDGGCFDNGRNGARAGIGVYWSPNDPLNISERLPGRPTNNRAEIHAAVRAVQQAKKKGIQNLILHTDSQFLINSITKWIKGWKRNQWTKTTGSPVINKEDFEELDKELKGINVKWVYVRGHAGNLENEAADSLAKKGAEKDL